MWSLIPKIAIHIHKVLKCDTNSAKNVIQKVLKMQSKMSKNMIQTAIKCDPSSTKMRFEKYLNVIWKVLKNAK